MYEGDRLSVWSLSVLVEYWGPSLYKWLSALNGGEVWSQVWKTASEEMMWNFWLIYLNSLL